MERLILAHCRLTDEQLVKIFTNISDKNFEHRRDSSEEVRLQELSVSNNRLNNLPVSLLKGVTRLRSLDCSNCDMKTDQVTKILARITKCEDEDLRLEHLNLEMNILTSVNFRLIADSLIKVKSVRIWGCQMLLHGLFEKILGVDEMALSHLNMGDTDLALYDPPTISNGLSKLESVDLSYCYVPPMILSMLATNLKRGRSKLKHLKMLCVHISDNNVKQLLEECLETFEN